MLEGRDLEVLSYCSIAPNPKKEFVDRRLLSAPKQIAYLDSVAITISIDCWLVESCELITQSISQLCPWFSLIIITHFILICAYIVCTLFDSLICIDLLSRCRLITAYIFPILLTGTHISMTFVQGTYIPVFHWTVEGGEVFPWVHRWILAVVPFRGIRKWRIDRNIDAKYKFVHGLSQLKRQGSAYIHPRWSTYQWQILQSRNLKRVVLKRNIT